MTKERPVMNAVDRGWETGSDFVIRDSSFGLFSFTADWERALMLHYEVAPEKLQPFVPFELDARNGKAYVSLVAFTMRGLRPVRGGMLTALPFRLIATHELLNVRTYVRHGCESGIYFLSEWNPNLLSVPLGGPVFGLPYHWGRITYRHEHEHGILFGNVRTRDGRSGFRYRGKVGSDFAPCAEGSLAAWLMERYVAFTDWRGWKRCFHVRHEPWPQCAVEAEVLDDSLLALNGEWARFARPIGATYSPGVRGVLMSKPARAGAGDSRFQISDSKSQISNFRIGMLSRIASK